MKEDTLKSTLERIGSKLTELRKQKGYTIHADFAYDYEIPRVRYWKIEKEKTNLTVKSVSRLLIIHKLTVEEFFCILHKENKIKDTSRNDFFSAGIKFKMKDILTKLEAKIKLYKDEHHGEMPLYILVSSHEADGLLDEVRKAGGYDADTLVTSYKGCKIIRHDSLTKGELMLTNELPETSS